MDQRENKLKEFAEGAKGAIAPTSPYSFESSTPLPRRRRFSLRQMVTSGVLALVAIVSAYFVRDAAIHPTPDVVLEVVPAVASGGIGSADAGTRIELPAKERLVVAVTLQGRGKNLTAMVYREGGGEPVWKGEELDPKSRKLSLILPVDRIPPADYVVRVRDAQGDDLDGVYRFTTVATR